DAHRFAGIVDNVDQTFLVPGAPRTANFLRASGEKYTSPLFTENNRKWVVVVVIGSEFFVLKRRLQALRSRHVLRPSWHSPVNACDRVKHLRALWFERTEGPPGFEVLDGIGGEIGAVLDSPAHFLHLRDRLPIHVGGAKINMAAIEDPYLLVHDAAPAVP